MTPQRRPDQVAFERLYRQNEQCRNEAARLRLQSDRLFVALAALVAFCAQHEREAIVQAKCSWLVAADPDPIAAARAVLHDVVAAAPR